MKKIKKGGGKLMDCDTVTKKSVREANILSEDIEILKKAEETIVRRLTSHRRFKRAIKHLEKRRTKLLFEESEQLSELVKMKVDRGW
jgi:hypothetical protein